MDQQLTETERALIKIMRKNECPMCDEPRKDDSLCQKCSEEIDRLAEKYENRRYEGEWR